MLLDSKGEGTVLTTQTYRRVISWSRLISSGAGAVFDVQISVSALCSKTAVGVDQVSLHKLELLSLMQSQRDSSSSAAHN